VAAGFVYIMINPAMPKLVKIGCTRHSPSKRARALRATGVPDDFVVVYDELVTDHKLLERRLHERFHNHRYTRNREFFAIPIQEAIRALMEESAGLVIPPVTTGGAELLPVLRAKYPDYLNPEFRSVKIVHIGDVVFLETTKLIHVRRDEIIERTDLSFISEEFDQPMFPPSRSPAENAAVFAARLDPYSIIQCTELFTDEACEKIAAQHERVVSIPVES
jgi:hypothetical protein